MGQAWAVSMKDTGLLLSPRLDLCVLYTQWRLILSSLTIALRLYKDKETYPPHKKNGKICATGSRSSPEYSTLSAQ